VFAFFPGHTMADEINYGPVLRAYPADCQPQAAEFLAGAGGFSGSRLWRLNTPQGLLCLRRWPAEHPTPERLEFIQAVLWHVHQEGFDRIPLPLETTTHQGYVRHAGHLWEITPWFAGAADYHLAPSVPRLRAAMTTLAAFHSAAASFPLPQEAECSSPGVAARRNQLAALRAGGWQRLQQTVARANDSSRAAARILECFPRAAEHVQQILDQAVQVKVALVPCLRDIWEENVLFLGDEVTGLIDAGAMRPENVAADVARLLGSLAEDDRSAWKVGLAAYESVRPLSEVELMLVTAFDTSGVLLGGINWLVWIYEQQRAFERPEAVQARLDYFSRRLAHLA
jgi:Ser/Thr protein kinase RdoA (MazF antagonist)